MGLFNKRKKILKELERRRNFNDKFCMINDCKPTPYMEGANNQLDELIKLLKK